MYWCECEFKVSEVVCDGECGVNGMVLLGEVVWCVYVDMFVWLWLFVLKSVWVYFVKLVIEGVVMMCGDEWLVN